MDGSHSFCYRLSKELEYDQDVCHDELDTLQVDLWARTDGMYEVESRAEILPPDELSRAPEQPATKLLSSQQTIHQHPAPSISSPLTTYDESPTHLAVLAGDVVSHSEEPRIAIPLSSTNNTPAQPLTHSPTTTTTSRSPSPSIKNTISQPSPHLSPIMEQPSVNQATEATPLLPPANIADERDQDGAPFCAICRCFSS